MKDNKNRLFEIMHKVTGMPLNEETLSYGTEYDDPNDDYNSEKAFYKSIEILYDEGQEAYNNGDVQKAESLRQEALNKARSTDWGENELPPYQ
jgi:hypothetical protein